jgi:hypothetical protein
VSLTTQREAWLNEVATLLLPEFRRVAGIKVYPKFRVSCGFPSTGRRSRRIGECWAPDASKDAVHEIFIHPGQDDPVEVAAILTHEIAHAVAGIPAKHGPEFKKLIKPLGLEGRACATVPGESFKQMISPLLRKAGKYPHGALAAGGISTKGPKQSTRMVKVECGGCGYIVRTSMKWILTGTPICPNEECSNHGEAMEVAL